MGFLARLRARLAALLSPATPRESPEPAPAPALPEPAPAPPAPRVAPPQPRRDRERRRLKEAEARAAAAEERARKAEQRLKEAEARATAAEERAKQSGQRLKQMEASARLAPDDSRREKRRARRSEAQAKEAEALRRALRAAEERAQAAERRAREAEESERRARDAVERERDLAREVMELEARLEEAQGRAPAPDDAPAVEVAFSPGDACLQAIRAQVARARRSIDACVFTITDDRIASALLDAHRRGVKVRVITDNDKSFDEGSDVDRLARAGIPVRKDLTEYHMHHKFAVFDGRLMLTGSYNWTRSAARYNEENLIVSGDPRLVEPFAREFDELWRRLAPDPGGSR